MSTLQSMPFWLLNVACRDTMNVDLTIVLSFTMAKLTNFIPIVNLIAVVVVLMHPGNKCIPLYSSHKSFFASGQSNLISHKMLQEVHHGWIEQYVQAPTCAIAAVVAYQWQIRTHQKSILVNGQQCCTILLQWASLYIICTHFAMLALGNLHAAVSSTRWFMSACILWHVISNILSKWYCLSSYFFHSGSMATTVLLQSGCHHTPHHTRFMAHISTAQNALHTRNLCNATAASEELSCVFHHNIPPAVKVALK